ncbi:DUF11 domain-containing protein [Paramicrobacterium fandaimingii]|uniref:DUF7927 domain-containing protein n=1 Tax=Paramicrobacterium fandaimingii TaxID=2708079 RepID=UPI0014236F50|nr:DUF11 domain-containing protein [Microbacterium fandaimingii]
MWTNRYQILQDTGDFRDLSYVLVNDTGYQYDVNLRDYHGFGSVIIADSLGNGDAECNPTYQSKSGGFTNCGTPFRIFFDQPDPDLPASAPSAAGTRNVLPPLLTDEDLAVTDLAFTPDSVSAASGTFAYTLNERFEGAYELQIDTDGNGSYADAVDRVVTLGADGAESYSYTFDGLDGEGTAIEDCTQMNARIFFNKVGEVHVTQGDVEGRTSGIEITRTNGAGAPDSTIHWDDTNLANDRVNTTPVLDGTAGVDSAGGVHGWDFAGDSWGNSRVIDDWAYSPIDYGTGEIAIGGRCMDVEKTSDADEETRVGDTVTYTVSATNTGDTEYTAEQPATFTDDLSGVLDDATYNEDAETDLPGDIAFADPKLSWTGALAAGETVTLTYTATVIAGGDGVGRNIAYGAPPETETPVCDPPNEDGTDPETGIACAEDVFELPRLTVEKAASETELPEAGTDVTYTVTVTNEGPGNFTVDAPAAVTDDLTDVIDDATYNDDAISTVDGTLTYEEPELTWTGALAAGESVTIEYTATYTGDGDQLLNNTACVPEDDALPGADPCANVSIPGAALNQWKSVEASGSPLVAGDTLTYTLHFESAGNIPVVVEAVDNLTDVLDDADVTVEPVSEGGVTAVRDGENITITGEVAAGTTATVTYTVTLRSDKERGNNVAANYLLAPGETPPPDCVPTDAEHPDCTVNTIPETVVSKSVNPESGTTVEPGQELTYTLTFKNIGEGAAAINYVDYMEGVLDDAELVASPETSDGLSAAGPEDGELTVTGTVEPGQSGTVTYTVRVFAYDDQGDHQLGNFLTPSGETPPTECVDTNPLCTQNPADPTPASAELPFTGGTVSWTAVGGGLLALLLGGGLLLAARRRQAAEIGGNE